MRSIVSRIALVACLVLCATGGSAAALDSGVFGFEEWQRALAELPLDANEVVYPFHATPEMVEWVNTKLSPYMTSSPEVRLQTLQKAFFENNEFEFEYDQAGTLTAEEAFAARSGNCMSFTSLFIALSRSAGIPTFLVSVRRLPDIEMDQGLVVVNRHVVAGYRAPNRIHTYDFYVASSTPVGGHRVIDDLTASAIYHTNIGGLAIRQGNLPRAIHNLEIATILAPDWAPGWVNLGVAFSRMSETDAAFDALQKALEAEPSNSSALINLSKLYRDQGREEEADNAMRAVAEGTRNPFTLITLAEVEILRGDYEKARQYLRRARWWYGKEPSVYQAMARLAEIEGDRERARRYRDKAAELRRAEARESD